MLTITALNYHHCLRQSFHDDFLILSAYFRCLVLPLRIFVLLLVSFWDSIFSCPIICGVFTGHRFYFNLCCVDNLHDRLYIRVFNMFVYRSLLVVFLCLKLYFKYFNDDCFHNSSVYFRNFCHCSFFLFLFCLIFFNTCRHKSHLLFDFYFLISLQNL